MGMKILIFLAVFAAGCHGQTTFFPTTQTTDNPNCRPRPCTQPGFIWFDEPICACWPQCGDWIRPCDPGFRWDFVTCSCIEACPGVICPGSGNPNSNTCDCECNLDAATCNFGEIVDQDSCSCIPDPNAVCPYKECGRGYMQFPYPMCDCMLICDYIMECDAGFKWDFIECGCVEACPGVSCPGAQTPNADTCECECTMDPAECSGPRTEFDPYMCDCKRYPCDPPWPCPEGEVIDWNVCNCVPDPNYSTTISHGGHKVCVPLVA